MTNPRAEESHIDRGLLDRLGRFQAQFRAPVIDALTESPDAALRSLRDAVAVAPPSYGPYLDEAVRCYDGGMYRATVLMIWAATTQKIYDAAGKDGQSIKAIQKANFARCGASKIYREVMKRDDFLYLKESTFLLLCEDAGLFNRNARQMLEERLTLRNRCGHPTGYRPGREETVIFVESLLLNIVSGSMFNW